MPVIVVATFEKNKSAIDILIFFENFNIIAADKNRYRSLGQMLSQCVQERSRADEISNVVTANEEDAERRSHTRRIHRDGSDGRDKKKINR